MPYLTQKSQVTIPKQARIALGVKHGDEVEFDINGGIVTVHKKAKKLPIEKWLGFLGRQRTDKLMEEIR
ncbi:AbrB/MazE/SpoVT family DNA-binding domain-containing protein [Candidatus Woesearchaeota archaeon]|nr:AbrB/MazE/SpoVT family DNA-binding domain-containing protein [Candidatus Woesearchaeota archaeon]